MNAKLSAIQYVPHYSNSVFITFALGPREYRAELTESVTEGKPVVIQIAYRRADLDALIKSGRVDPERVR